MRRHGMVSVIIPVLNGATRLAATLAAVKADANEVVVVDGGSTDGSQSIAAAAGARVLSAPRGRGSIKGENLTKKELRPGTR